MQVVGYSDRLSVRQDEVIRFMVSSVAPRYRADMVRLIHGDSNPLGPGFKAESVAADVGGERDGRVQKICGGSYVRVPDACPLELDDGFTTQLWLMPTTPERGIQTIVDGGAFALRIVEGRLALDLGGDAVTTPDILAAGRWHMVVAGYDGRDGEAFVGFERLDLTVPRQAGLARLAIGRSPIRRSGDLLIAAEQVGEDVCRHLNGKIEAPRIFNRVLSARELSALRNGVEPVTIGGLVAAWDFSRGISSRHITDVSGNGRHGRTVNMPMRGATGRNWNGTEVAWPHAPEQYGAIHFHDDDLDDAGWDVDFEWRVPRDLPSGVYAAHLQAPGGEDYVPFVVRPRLGRPGAPILVLLPTFSYLAYGNEQLCASPETRELMRSIGATGQLAADYPSQPQDRYIVSNRLLSLYDTHSDGSGVCYSSRLRPVLNMRPKYHMPGLNLGSGSPHQFNADLCLVDWLTEHGYDFDVVTDEDLHHDGIELVRAYDVVLTGSHCEYYSGQQIDTLQEYLHGGGRLMYLGGNGFYWVTQLDPEEGHTIEIRRVGPSTRSWEPAPGEAYLSTSGELGGLWRYRGRSPQSWLGVGFTAQGVGAGRPYERGEGGRDPRAAFVFEGLGDDELIGDNPSLVNGYGAAGFELDRLDHSLGTPLHTILLATATGFSDDYQHVSEETFVSTSLQGGTVNPLVRADMVLVAYPNDGAVFSTGSISWTGSLPINRYDNTVSKVTKNVLDRFLIGGVPSPD